MHTTSKIIVTYSAYTNLKKVSVLFHILGHLIPLFRLEKITNTIAKVDYVDCDCQIVYIRRINTSRLARWSILFFFIFILVLMSTINKILMGADL